MKRLLLVLALLAAACAPGGFDPEEPTVPAPNSSLRTTTTTEPSMTVEIDDCSAPQVTFSPLCETFELIQKWHVDRPADAAALAEAARNGLSRWTTDEVEDPPRTMFCAIPDPSFNDFCADLALRVETSSIPIGPAIEAAVLAMTDLGLDPFSYYLPPDQVGAFRSNGLVEGVGILLDATDAAGSKCVRITAACELRIVYVLQDNPGATAGLAAGDIITSVDGETVDGLGFVDTATRISGDETGSVGLIITRDGEQHEFTVDRGELDIPTVEVGVPVPDVGYIRIPDFDEDIPSLLDDALDSLLEEGVGTVVLDLRDNGGGWVDVALDVISEFVVEGTTILRTVGPDEDFAYEANSGGRATTQELIVLVNEGTASAAEITAAALQEVRSAPVVGTTTFGKDAVQIAFEIRNGGEFYVAVARWLSPNNSTVGNGGLIPDHEAELPASLTVEELVEIALDIAR
ncbi:MAG: S41 family peptidase [Acidimicrobiia bacterium]